MSAEPEAVCHVRRLVMADLPSVLAIERASYDFPWSEGIFRDCLRVGYRGFAAVDLGGNLMGYALLSVAVGDAHVLNLCVGPEYRRQGVASQLLAQMTRQARRERADTLLLEVRPSNEGAIALYEGLGFNQVGLRKRYYPAVNGREDALLLAKAI